MANPRGNITLHRVTNGAGIDRDVTRLVSGRLPENLKRVQKDGWNYKRCLEAAVADKKGSVDLVDAHSIDCATGYQIHHGILMWLLRTRLSSMSTRDVRECSRALAESKEKRNKAMRELGLDVEQQQSIVGTLYEARGGLAGGRWRAGSTRNTLSALRALQANLTAIPIP